MKSIKQMFSGIFSYLLEKFNGAKSSVSTAFVKVGNYLVDTTTGEIVSKVVSSVKGILINSLLINENFFDTIKAIQVAKELVDNAASEEDKSVVNIGFYAAIAIAALLALTVVMVKYLLGGFLLSWLLGTTLWTGILINYLSLVVLFTLIEVAKWISTKFVTTEVMTNS